MGTEQKGINEALNLSMDFGDPHLGRRRKDLLPYDKAEMKFAVGCLGNEDFRLQANDIMTRSMRCQGTLGKPGDIMVVEQADGKEKIRLWMMVFFMVLGIISEIFINPNFSALIFQLF